MSSTLATYGRLLGYAKPYWGRLTVGIVAGFVSGGSIFGILHSLPDALRPFEAPQVVAAPASEQGEATADAPEVPPAERELSSIEKLAESYGIPAAKPDGTMTWQFMVLGILALPLLVGLRGIAIFTNQYTMQWVGARVVVDVRNRLFEHLQSQSLSFFGKSNVGQLISRCTNDTAIIERAVPVTITGFTRAPLEVIAAVVFIFVFAVANDIVLLVTALALVFPLCIVPIVLLGRFLRRYVARALARISELVSRMQENFTGIRVVKAFHTELHEGERFRHMNQRYFQAHVKSLRAELCMSPLVEIAGASLACIFVVYCYATGIYLYQILPLGVAAVIAYKPIKQLVRTQVQLQRGVAAAERIFAIMDVDTSLPEPAEPTVIEGFRNRLVCDHVSFDYGTDGGKVLDDICLDIPRGSVVAFVGSTGTGKSTIVNLLARFYDPVKGRILLDGIDLREIEIASLRRLFGVVTQDTILFNDTIASNIAYGTPDASMDDIIEAAKKANAHPFIMADPMGYKRVVGEKGFVLSGGEKQRVAIARAVLRNPPILILDEATSALDTVTEQLVKEAIERVMEDRTVLAVAHRLSTIKHADQICVLQNGHIVERGTHQELYDAGGPYRGLCDMQFS